MNRLYILLFLYFYCISSVIEKKTDSKCGINNKKKSFIGSVSVKEITEKSVLAKALELKQFNDVRKILILNPLKITDYFDVYFNDLLSLINGYDLTQKEKVSLVLTQLMRASELSVIVKKNEALKNLVIEVPK